MHARRLSYEHTRSLLAGSIHKRLKEAEFELENPQVRKARSAPSQPAAAPSRTLPGRQGSGASAAPSGEEARLRDLVLQEVLDTRPSVAWNDIAGLAGAKQVRSEWVEG